MKEQKGSICIMRDNWVLRWRETVNNGDGTASRKKRFKILGTVTSDHRRNKERKTGKIRVPDEIKALADATMEPVKNAPASVLLTIGEFVVDYLRDRKESLKASTYNGYERIWEAYLLHRVARKVLRDFQRPDAFNLWRQIAKAHPTLSRQSMNHIRFFLSGVFNAALNRGLYSGDNPATADLPSGLRGRSETGAYSVDEVLQMFPLLADLQAQAIIALAFGGGLRKGELAAIRWDDYEQTDSGAILHVRQASWNGIISTPKTESSADVVHVGPEICAFLDAYRQSIGAPANGLMFCYAPDRPINLDSFARWKLKPVFKLHDIPWKGWHAFRRGNATFLAKQIGSNGLKAASLMLRHGDDSITREHYIKNTRQDRRALEARKDIERDEQRGQAAATIGAGLKQLVQ